MPTIGSNPPPYPPPPYTTPIIALTTCSSTTTSTHTAHIIVVVLITTTAYIGILVLAIVFITSPEAAEQEAQHLCRPDVQSINVDLMITLVCVCVCEGCVCEGCVCDRRGMGGGGGKGV
jgi:hypothetical protein